MKISDRQSAKEIAALLAQSVEADPREHLNELLSVELTTYRDLQRVESEIDRLLSEKRIQLTETLARASAAVQVTLRIAIQAEFEAQNELKISIYGRAIGVERSPVRIPAFTDLFRELHIEFCGLGVEGAEFGAVRRGEKRQRAAGFRLLRQVPDEELASPLIVSLSGTFEHASPLFTFNEAMARIVGRPRATRNCIMRALLRYLRSEKLIRGDLLGVDEALREALCLSLECESIRLSELSVRVQSVVELDAFRLTADFGPLSALGTRTRTFDTLITLPLEEVPSPLLYFLPKLVGSDAGRDRRTGPNPLLALQAQLNDSGRAVAQCFEELYEHYTRWLAFRDIARAPAAALKRLVDAQRRRAAAAKAVIGESASQRQLKDENEFLKTVLENHAEFARAEVEAFLAESR